jgi:subtilisin family serine protease
MRKLFEVLALATVLAVACQRVSNVPEQPQDAPTEEAVAAEPQVQQVKMYLGDDLVQQVETALESGTYLTKSQGFNSVLDQLDVVSMERLFPDAGEFEPRHRKAGLHKWYVVTYKGSMPATKAQSTLVDIPGVEVVEIPQKEVINSISFFNDPYEYLQWHYHNDGTARGARDGVDVDVIPVWNNITTGDPNVVVAVVDKGIDFSHEDLAGRVDLANSYNFINHSGSITPGDHGTHVAGTIAAINNNGVGVSGIAGGDAAAGKEGTTLLTLQIFEPDGKGGGFGEQAIVWAADHGAVICNNSWGYNFWNEDRTEYDLETAKKEYEVYSQPNTGAYVRSLKTAVDYFNQHAGFDANGKQVGPMAGGVTFFSAGNDRNEYGVPAVYEGITSVGSVGPSGVIASYSCYGDWVDIAAPGGESQYERVYSTVPDNKYGYMQGTSMACPHVSGVAALVVAACGGQGFTREMLLEKLLNGTSTKVDLQGFQIGPLVDAWNAVNYGTAEAPDPVNTMTLEVNSNTITARWNVTGHEGVPAAGFQLQYSTSQSSLEASSFNDRKEGVEAEYFTVSAEKVGTSVSLKIPDLVFETDYYFRIYAYSTPVVHSDASATLSAKTGTNHAPVITPDGDISNLRIKASETRLVNFSIVDPDGHEITVTHTPGSAADTWRENQDGSFTLQIDGTKAKAGSYSCRIVAKDAYSAVAETTVNYTIMENHGPVLAKGFDNIILNEKGASFSLVLSDYFTDEDGDNLTFTANSSSSALHVTANSGKLSGTAMTDGLAVVKVTATDPLKKSVSTEFKVAVRTSGVLVSAYPSPVTDILYITNNEVQPHSMEVKLVASTGGVMLTETVSASAFEPAALDVSRIAPGVYTVVITFNDTEYKQTVVKQ